MSRLFQIFLVVILGGATKFTLADTLVDDQFYGVWSTASSVLSPKRQILNLSKDGGSWILIDDAGKEEQLTLNKDNISIAYDLLTVLYRNDAQGYALKLVLEGWDIDNDKAIFGTVFMYREQNKVLQLFNGIPVSFKSGISQIPPQVFWSFFKSDEINLTNASAIQTMEESLIKINGIQINEGKKTKDYWLKRINSVITITQKGHPAYPSAIGFQLYQKQPDIIRTAAQYAGNKNEFTKFYNEYTSELRQQQRETEKYINNLIKRKDATNSSE